MRPLYPTLLLAFIVSGCLESATPGQQQGRADHSKGGEAKESPAVAPLDPSAKVPLLRTHFANTNEPVKSSRPDGISLKDQTDFAQLSDDVLIDGEEQKNSAAPPVKRLNNGLLQVGRVIVDRAKKSLRIPSQVNMSEGLIEYYAVGPKGKLHESVLVLFAPSSHIHLSLILLGAEPGIPNGTRLDLTIEWKDRKTGEPKTAGAHEWLLKRKTKTPPKALTWFFAGSRFSMGKYSADQSQSTISLIQDIDAVIDVMEAMGVPYRGDALGFQAHKAIMPRVGTRTTLHIKLLHTPVPLFPKPTGTSP